MNTFYSDEIAICAILHIGFKFELDTGFMHKERHLASTTQ